MLPAQQLKRDLKERRIRIEQVIADPPDYVLTAKVYDMLVAVATGPAVKAGSLLTQCRISQSKTVGGLSSVSAPSCWTCSGRADRSLGGSVSSRHLVGPVIAGPSGVGKGTLISQALQQLPELAVATSATTRPRRASERDGVETTFCPIRVSGSGRRGRGCHGELGQLLQRL